MSSSIKDRLLDKRYEIQKNILQVHTNQCQCQRLLSRIDQLIDPLERLEHTNSLFLRQETRLILDNFLQCLDDCNNFIEKFSSSTKFCEDIYEKENIHKKFQELNTYLSQFGQDLSLGLNIQEIFNRKQDQEDQQQDYKNLIQNFHEIFQQQHESIDKIIHQRFQSFRYHLEKQFLIKQETNLNEQTHFLHIPYKDLNIEKTPISHGGFADVYKGIWLTHHDEVAIKILRINHSSNIQNDFYQEISMMYKIHYEHILTILGACIQPNFYAIITEYMPLGSLYDVLHKQHDEIILSWSDRYSLTWQMAKSINYLHNLNPYIIHRDIKSMNFLLKKTNSDQHRFLLKVCDFGLAEIRYETLVQSKSSEIVGSLAWKAPELLINHENYTKQTDIYSLGITMWELATGKKPWNEYSNESIIIVLVEIEERPKIPSDIPEEYKQAIEDAWNQNPLKRPSCFDLMERMYKQINQLTTTPVNLYSQQIPTDIDSTRISIPVMEENQLTDRLSNIIISNHHISSSSLDNKEILSEKSLTNQSFEQSLSNSSSTNVTIEETHLSKSSNKIYRSIIGKITTPSDIKDQNNHPKRNRHRSIIKQDSDSLPIVYRF